MKRRTNSKRVLLIDPKGFGAGLNLGLGYLAAILIKNNYQVKVVDCNNTPSRLSQGPKFKLGIVKEESWQEKIDRGLRWKPEVIGLSINSFTLENGVKIIEYCRSKIKYRPLFIVGGPHITQLQKDFMNIYKNIFDYAVVGEGEETIIDLFTHLNRPKMVKGIIFYDRKKKELIQTEPRPLIVDLDSLPFPRFDVFDTVRPKKGLFNYQMITSRGCPYKCVFCCRIWTRKWRARTPENVLKEIKLAIKKYHSQSLTFWDDNFTLDINRAKKICQLLISKKIRLKYSLAGIRADRLDEELIRKFKESGCTSISMGIEDGDPKTFPFVGKGETLADIKKAVKLIQKHEIPLIGYMVIGLINSSYKSFLRSLKFIEGLGITAHWSIAFPFPNTDLFNWVKENGRFLIPLEEGFKHSMTGKEPPVVFDTVSFPKEERLKTYYLGNLRSKSYDMVIGSRGGNVFQQTLDIIEAVWKYDREKFYWHFSNLLKLFLKSIRNFGRIQ